MTITALTDAEVKIGIEHVHKKYGYRIAFWNLVHVKDRLHWNRVKEDMDFTEALEEALEHFGIGATQNALLHARYTSAILKAYNLRAQNALQKKRSTRQRSLSLS